MRRSHFLISRQSWRCSVRTATGRQRKHFPQMISPERPSSATVRRQRGLMQGILSGTADGLRTFQHHNRVDSLAMRAFVACERTE